MASRIHNFSYSGSTGALTFVPCTGTEVACKVYIKSIVTDVSMIGSDGSNRYYGSLILSTKSSDNTKNLQRASFNTEKIGGGFSYSVTLAGGCTSQVISNAILTPTSASPKIGLPNISIYSGVGYAVASVDSGIEHSAWNVPEYFYMKPGETLTLSGYVGTFHIELMGISETN